MRLRDWRSLKPTKGLLLAAARAVVRESGRGAEFDGVRVVHLGDEPLGPAAEDHPVPRRPQCPVCGDPELLHHSTPGADVGTKTRVREMLARVSPVTGFVTAMRTQRRGGLYFSDALFASPRAPGLPRMLRQEVAMASGTGTSRSDALVRCFGEAVERYSIVMQGHEPVVVASWQQLRPEDRCPVELLRPYSESQYRNFRDWNRGEWGFPIILPPLELDELTEWSPARSLVDGRISFLPTQMVYFGSARRGRLWWLGDTNGCAAGATVEAAVLSALLELIERDATAIWWYNRLRRPPVTPELLQALEARPWVRYLEKQNRPFWVLDLTTDIGIPVAAAISESKRGGRIALGFGCDPDPQAAVVRALRELSQKNDGTEKAQPEQFRRNTMQRAFVKWSVAARADAERHLFPDIASSPLKIVPTAGNTVLSQIVRRLSAVGCEPNALLLSRAEIGWPVVRVACPGLCHPWHRLKIARIRTAPVQMGLLDAPLEELQLNPVPFTL